MSENWMPTDSCNLGAECDISVSKLLGFETFPIFWMVSDSVSKNLVSKKVSDSVLKKNWYRKKYWIRYQKKMVLKNIIKNLGFVCLKHGFVKVGIEKSFGFGIGNI